MTNPSGSAPGVCEVYEEPRHRFRLRNAWTNVYEIELPRNEQTLFHRHTEDTVYFVVADAEVRESFPDKPAILTTATAGGTMCRAHKHEPLVHQVRNVGAGLMHLLGAEAIAQPPASATVLPDLAGHTLKTESGRFRVFDVAVGEQAVTIGYDVYGLLVTFVECTLGSVSTGTAGAVSVGLSPGGFVWLEPSVDVTLPVAFRGIFTQWI
ncbi:MAG: hypothetical protein ACU85U_14580 [Gammaproteobacteria bacterium]|jgi:hypothetical protein